MRAIGSLILSYFTGTTWQRWLTSIGLAIIVAGLLGIDQVARSIPLQAVCFLGCGAFFAGSALMPKVFGHLVRSHAINVLPFGRLKLLVSALLATVLVALPLPILSVMTSNILFSRTFPKPHYENKFAALIEFLQLPFLWNLVANVFLFCSLLYVVLWFLTNSRTVLGKVLTLIVAVAAMALPREFVSINPGAAVTTVVVTIIISWTLFAGGLLLYPRWRLPGKRCKEMGGALLSLRSERLSATGNELELMLGVASPWLLAFAIVVCIALDTLFIRDAGPWLFFLSVLAIVSSAIAALAATRSRSLWLRRPWSRAELFAQIEALLWRHNSFGLAIMLLWYVAIGTYADVAIPAILIGLPLILVSAAVSLYLGLMQAGSLKWVDAVLAVVATLLIMSAAILATETGRQLSLALCLLVALCGFTVVFREIARRRWTEIDWSLCKPTTREAGAS